MIIQKTKKVSKNSSESNQISTISKCKRKDILITKKIEKLIQKRQVEVVPSNLTLELIPQYQFYLSGEIVVDFDIFKEDRSGFKKNPTNLFKVLDRMTKCKNHIELETTSNVTMMNNFEIVIATINRVQHPRAREMASLLQDYQDKVSKRIKYSSILQEQQIQKGIKIDYAIRKEQSFRNAQQILDTLTKDNPQSIFFFVIRRKGLFSIDVLKSGYSYSAVKLSGFTIEDFEQSILRDRCVPIKHQNNAWDYVKEKMYSNFHNKNYTNVQRKVTLKSGQALNIFMNARSYPLNVNISPDSTLLDLNDYLELILIEPFQSKVDRFAEANDLVIQNQKQYAEQSNKFVQKFYSQEDLKKMGFVKNQSGLSKNKGKKCVDVTNYLQNQDTSQNSKDNSDKNIGNGSEQNLFSSSESSEQSFNQSDTNYDIKISQNQDQQQTNNNCNYTNLHYKNSISTEDLLQQIEPHQNQMEREYNNPSFSLEKQDSYEQLDENSMDFYCVNDKQKLFGQQIENQQYPFGKIQNYQCSYNHNLLNEEKSLNLFQSSSDQLQQEIYSKQQSEEQIRIDGYQQDLSVVSQDNQFSIQQYHQNHYQS